MTLALELELVALVAGAEVAGVVEALVLISDSVELRNGGKIER